MKKITIAIDGHSSTGKSTLAKQLAQALNYIYVDTGAMYRAVTLYALNHEMMADNSLNIPQLIKQLDNISMTFHFNPEVGFAEMYLNGTNVEKEIRSMEVSQWVSKIAEVSEIRAKLVQQQQGYGKEKGIVMDGRDIGTVVFPDAELKVFMTASAEIRAKRRFEELKEKGQNVNLEDVLQNVQERDRIDSSRADSPLIQAEDAVVIDNSQLTKKEQFDLILKLAQARIKN